MNTLVPSLSVRRNPIGAALARARTVIAGERAPVTISPPGDITVAVARFDRQIGELANNISEISSLRKTLLGVEKQQREQLSAQIATLEKQRRELRKKKNQRIYQNRMSIRQRKRLEREAEADAELVARYCGEYKRLDLAPLTWRNKKGLPLVAIFSLDNGIFSLGARTVRRSYVDHNYFGTNPYWRRSIKQMVTPSLPKPLKVCFNDILAKMHELAKQKKKTVLLSAEFSGIIPLEVKQKIIEVKKKFKGIFILAEVKDWKIEERNATTERPKPAPIVQGDPLVVGWDGKGFWLIAAFDTTNLERYIEQVHCAKQQGERSKN